MVSSMKRILFVCTGNTCRSAMAEYICRQIASEQSIEVKAKSCGVAAFEGEHASDNAVLALKELYSIDLTPHRSRLAERDLVEWADVIFTMSARHADALLGLFPECESKIVCASPEICDPFMQSLTVYKACAEQLHAQINRLVLGEK